MLLISNALLILARDRQIDILFANAGTGEFGPLGAITEEHFDKTFNANVKGLLFSVQKAFPLLKDGSSFGCAVYAERGRSGTRNDGRIQNVAVLRAHLHLGSKRPQKPCEGCESWRDSFSGLPQSLGLTDEQIKQYTGSAVDKIPLGRTGTLDEVAKVVSFLASDESSYLIGIELFVDGGMAQI